MYINDCELYTIVTNNIKFNQSVRSLWPIDSMRWGNVRNWFVINRSRVRILVPAPFESKSYKNTKLYWFLRCVFEVSNEVSTTSLLLWLIWLYAPLCPSQLLMPSIRCSECWDHHLKPIWADVTHHNGMAALSFLEHIWSLANQICFTAVSNSGEACIGLGSGRRFLRALARWFNNWRVYLRLYPHTQQNSSRIVTLTFFLARQ